MNLALRCHKPILDPAWMRFNANNRMARRTRHIDCEMPAADGIVLSWSIPHRPYFHFASTLHDFGRLAALLLYVGLDDLRSDPSGKLPVLATFEQHRDHKLGIAPWGHTNEPGIVFEIGLAASELGLELVADGLRAARLPGKIDALQMRAARGSQRRGHIRHGIRDDLPVLGINRNLHFVGCVGSRHRVRRQLRRKGNMRAMHYSPAGDSTDRSRQLHRSHGHGALPNAYGNRFPGIPLLLEVADLPFFRGHHAADFLRKVDPGFLSESESGRILRNAPDAQPLRQRV